MSGFRCQETDDREQKSEAPEFGSGTRRRPIGRDYSVAKDAECGMEKHRAKGIAHSVKGEKISAPPLVAEAASLIRKKVTELWSL